MKLGIIGGASVRTPLLIKNLLSRSDYDLDSIALFDTDPHKQELMYSILKTIAEKTKSSCRLDICSSFEAMAEGADFVFSSFRQGGDEGRIFDEEIPEEFGMLGQETVGAGGAAMALRTIPVALEYAEKLHSISPEAWIINFTNPSGIISQALMNYSSHKRIIGICDAPVVVKNMAARYFDCEVNDIEFKSFGLNHLGWIYDIRLKGVSVLDRLVREAEEFVKVEPLYIQLVDHIKTVKMIPNEYLLFYLYSEEIRKNYSDHSYKRSEFIADINKQLFSELEKNVRPGIEIYQEYLAKRENSYMAIETGNIREDKQTDFFSVSNNFGYDDVAIAVMDALRGKGDISLPVNRKNENCPYLEKDDVVEVSTIICKDGLKSGFEVPELPDSCVELIKNVKFYERNLIDGFMKKDKSLMVKALKSNPLVRDNMAEKLLDKIIDQHNILGF